MSASALSKPPLMSRKSDETLSAGSCIVGTVSIRAVHVSKKESEGRELHWLRWRRPTYLAMAKREEATILSTIFEMVRKRTIMRNDASEL